MVVILRVLHDTRVVHYPTLADILQQGQQGVYT